MAIPEGWEERRLEEVCLERGQYGANSPKQPYDPMLPRYVRITDIDSAGRLKKEDPVSIDWASAEGHILSDGDILLARSGATVGKSYLHRNVTIPCAFAGYLIRFRPELERLAPEFLAQYLYTPTYWKWVADTQRAQAQPNINAAEYGSLLLPLPPLPEQKKIAAILSSVDEVIAKTEAVIAQLQIVKKAMMEQLLTKGMPGRHTRFKQTEIGEIPEEWEVVSLERAASRIVVGVVIQPASYYVPDGIPALRSLNVKDDEILLDKLVFFSDASNQQLSKSQIRTGDVLTVRTGVPGVSACVPAALNGANCIDLIITTPSAALRGEFLSRFINSDRGRGAILKRQGGLAQQHFNVGEMKQLLVPIPSIEEQDLIIERLQVIDARLGVERALAKAITIVKAALSSSLLSGEIRVIPEVA